MTGEKSGCFTWCVRLKEACNERWARFRNRLRRRFYARRGQQIDPASIMNETGTKDMLLSKTPSKSYEVIPDIVAARNTVTESSIGAGGVLDKNFDIQVGEYVARIIQTAADKLNAEARLLSNTKIITTDADDNVSLTSSVISQIADIAVADSLTNIVMENDISQPATKGNIVEFMGNIGNIPSDKNIDGLPSVNI